MTDVVQFRMERMTEEIDDLGCRSLFTHYDIAAIVKHCHHFEFRFKCPSPFKQDFLDYIDYERHLDDLRKKKKILGDALEKDKSGKKWRKLISEVSGVIRKLISDVAGVKLWSIYV